MIVSQAPLSSAFARSLDPNNELKQPLIQLVAAAADAGYLNAWMQTEDASKGRNRPEPILPQLIGSRSQEPLEVDQDRLDELDRIFAAPRTEVIRD